MVKRDTAAVNWIHTQFVPNKVDESEGNKNKDPGYWSGLYKSGSLFSLADIHGLVNEVLLHEYPNFVAFTRAKFGLPSPDFSYIFTVGYARNLQSIHKGSILRLVKFICIRPYRGV